jgi:hypothetical protein
VRDFVDKIIAVTRAVRTWSKAAGTHAGAVSDKHLQAYLDEFTFRYNRRMTNGVGRIAARVIEKLVVHPPRTMRQIIDETKRCRWFASNQVVPNLSERHRHVVFVA